jgi:hypothetical protein
LQALHAPYCVVPQDWPLVLRLQPMVSVSVDVDALQVPAWQVYVVTLRVRLPELLQVSL